MVSRKKDSVDTQECSVEVSGLFQSLECLAKDVMYLLGWVV